MSLFPPIISSRISQRYEQIYSLDMTVPDIWRTSAQAMQFSAHLTSQHLQKRLCVSMQGLCVILGKSSYIFYIHQRR